MKDELKESDLVYVIQVESYNQSGDIIFGGQEGTERVVKKVDGNNIYVEYLEKNNLTQVLMERSGKKCYKKHELLKERKIY